MIEHLGQIVPNEIKSKNSLLELAISSRDVLSYSIYIFLFRLIPSEPMVTTAFSISLNRGIG